MALRDRAVFSVKRAVFFGLGPSGTAGLRPRSFGGVFGIGLRRRVGGFSGGVLGAFVGKTQWLRPAGLTYEFTTGAILFAYSGAVQQ